MISKYKNAQLVYLNGKIPVKINRVIRRDEGFYYELRETGDIVPEERLSLLKNYIQT